MLQRMARVSCCQGQCSQCAHSVCTELSERHGTKVNVHTMAASTAAREWARREGRPHNMWPRCCQGWAMWGVTTARWPCDWLTGVHPFLRCTPQPGLGTSHHTAHTARNSLFQLGHTLQKHCGKPADRAEGTDRNAGLAWGRQVLRMGMRSENWRSCSSKIWLGCHSQAGVAGTQLLQEALASLHNSSGTAAACQWGCDSEVMLPLSDAPKTVHTWGDPTIVKMRRWHPGTACAWVRQHKVSVLPHSCADPQSSAHRWPISRDQLPHKLVNLGCPLA